MAENKTQKQDKRITGRTKSLVLKVTPQLHRELKTLAARRNCFMTEVLEEAWKKYLKKEQIVYETYQKEEEKQEKEQLRKKLIAGYQIRVKNEKLKKTLQTYGEMSWEDLSVKLKKDAK